MAVDSWKTLLNHSLQSYQFTAIHIYNKEIHRVV
jgi:hypothetical protein